jgi:hypothetical protein
MFLIFETGEVGERTALGLESCVDFLGDGVVAALGRFEIGGLGVANLFYPAVLPGRRILMTFRDCL